MQFNRVDQTNRMMMISGVRLGSIFHVTVLATVVLLFSATALAQKPAQNGPRLVAKVRSGEDNATIVLNKRRGVPRKEINMTELATAPSTSADDKPIRPFRVNFPEEQLVDLRRRIAATKWPEYDWRKMEARLRQADGARVEPPPPAGLSPDEKHAWDQLDDFYKNGLGYALEMNNRPQTLYAIVDSPVGLAAWMIDHDIRSYQMIARAFDGKPEGLTRDDILDNVTLYWLTNTAISSARLYWDTRHNLPPGGFFDVRGIKIPVAVSAFPDEIYQAPRSWAEKAYPKLIHYNRLPKGTHFAAWEQPEFFVSELRASFKSLR